MQWAARAEQAVDDRPQRQTCLPLPETLLSLSWIEKAARTWTYPGGSAIVCELIVNFKDFWQVIFQICRQNWAD